MNGLVQASVAAIVLVGSSAAVAADMPAVAPLKAVPIVAYGWTGFYAGLHGGYAWGNGSINLTDNRGIGLGLFPATLAANPSGFLGGVQAGYNYQLGQWLFGVESDIAGAEIKRAQSRAIFTGDLPTPSGQINIFNQTITTTGENKLNAFGTFRLRLGVTPIDRLLLYLTGGFAYGHARANSTVTTQTIAGGGTFAPCQLAGGADTCATGGASRWLGGWTAGGGFELALIDNWSVKAEYLYYNLGSIQSFRIVDPLNPPFILNANADFRGQMFRAGLNYRFDWGSSMTARY